MSVHWLCDKEDDCGDGSDERNCSWCAPADFKCFNGGCVDASKVCNGINDCEDGSDENDSVCSNKRVGTCKANQFSCGDNKTCVAKSKVCDKKIDCPSGTDEKGCSVNNCADRSLNKCTQFCIDLPNGYKCGCKKGFSLDSDERSCIDIDECKDYELSGCSQACLNTIGSFKCACSRGFKWESVSKLCKLDGRFPAPKLLFSSHRVIRTMSLNGRILSVLQNRRNIYSVDFHKKDASYYWTENFPGEIRQARLNQVGKSKNIVSSVIRRPYHLSVDWVGNNIYFTDAFLHGIFVCSFRSKFAKQLLLDHHSQPRALAVYPEGGWLYYTVEKKFPCISRMGLNGSNQSKIIIDKIGRPKGIAVDYVSKKIYWSDFSYHRIEIANLDGSMRRTVCNKLRAPFGLAVFGDFVFWTDVHHATINKAHKITGILKQVIKKNKSIPWSIKVNWFI